MDAPRPFFELPPEKRIFSDRAGSIDRYGHSVAYREDGIVVLGAPQGLYSDPSTGPGKVGIFQKENGGAWKETHTLVPEDGNHGARFGVGVAITERHLLVSSSHFIRKGDQEEGAVFVYEAPYQSDPSEWKLQDILFPPEELRGKDFGVEMVVGDGYLAVSAILAGNGVGAVCIYREVAANEETVWQFHSVVRPVNPRQKSTYLGESIAMGEGLLAVTAHEQEHPEHASSGAVHLFEIDEDRAQWLPTAVLFPVPDKEKNWQISGGVSLDGSDRLLMGVRGTGSGRKGAILTFSRKRNGDWVQTGGLLPPAPAEEGTFGMRIVVRGDHLFVGSDEYAPAGLTRLGSVYLYHRNPEDPSNWLPVHQFVPSFSSGMMGTGYQIAVGKNEALFGTPLFSRKRGGAFLVKYE